MRFLMKWLPGTFLLSTLLLAAQRPAQAQDLEEPRARQGYWFAFGLTSGGTEVVEKGKSLGLFPTSGFSLRIGEMLTRRVGVGLALEYAGMKKNGDSGALGGLAMEVNASVWRHLAVHGGAGFGFSMLTNQTTDDDDTLRGGAGAYLLAGASYDFFPWRSRLTGGWSITPTINLRAMPDGDVHAFAILAGLQVIRWSGLPRAMLVLPDP
jgi:hypothetical protein